LLLSLLLLLGHGTGEDRLGTLARQLWNFKHSSHP
jgi:hypothetical protein